MKFDETLTLMNKDDEVLSFFVDYLNKKVVFNKKLKHFDKAPYKLLHTDDVNLALTRFFNLRRISESRRDYEQIMQATGSKNSLELALKRHALSLSDHFWIKREGENLKYKDINFFTNKWDDSFAKAALHENYEALKDCDINVPDVVTPGWGVKGWICEDIPKLYKLGIHEESSDECLAEVLVSRVGRRLLNKEEVTDYELKTVGNKYASVSPVMINYNEELVALSNVLPAEMYSLYLAKSHDKNLDKKFFEKIKAFGMPELFQFFVKLSVLRSICFVSDLHFENVSLIKDLKTNKFRVAPMYDFGGAFGSSRSGKELLSNPNKGLYLLIYFMFSNLDPNWDYSWYDPRKLVGVEDEIREIFSKSEFYSEELIERIVAVYQMQKESLDKVAKCYNQ